MKLKHATYSSPGEPGKRGFEDLEVYKIVLDIIVNSEELAKNLPLSEKYDLALQIRRSSKAIAANIAEGYGRYHYLDSLRFYSIARGELNETLAHFINSSVLGYIDQDFFESIYKLIRQAEMALNGFMNYVRKKRGGINEFGNHLIHDESSEYALDFLAKLNEKPSSPLLAEEDS